MDHLTPIKVRGYHLDLYGHVNNARYLEFLEEARWAYLEHYQALAWFMQHGYALVISRIEIDYQRSAGMGDELLVHTRLDRLERRTGHIAQRIVRADNGKCVVQAQVSFAVVHPDHPGARPIEGEIAARLSLLQPEPESI